MRYLRKIYTDPMTGKADWALDPPPPPPGGSNIEGGTVASGEHFGGVHSVSDAEPLKKDNFDLEDIKFTNISGAGRKARYSDWLFDYDPNAPAPNANVGSDRPAPAERLRRAERPHRAERPRRRKRNGHRQLRRDARRLLSDGTLLHVLSYTRVLNVL